MYYLLIGRRYLHLFGSDAWALAKYKENATAFDTHEDAARFARALLKKGYEATVSGP